MRATTSRADGVRRREHLLDSALACFTEHGVLNTGIEEIRRRAGASPSSVYHHFDGLEDLTAALLVRIFGNAVRGMDERVLPTTTARSAVHALVDSYLGWAFGHLDEARFMYQALALELSGTHRARLRDTKARMQAPVFAHLDSFVARGTLPDWPAPVLNAVLLGPAHDSCRRHLAGARLDPVWLRATLPELAWRSVRPARNRR